MIHKEKHISYTAADIARYHAGKMSAKEMHDIERAALADAFLADALEGYPIDDKFDDSVQDLREVLQKRIGEKEEKRIAPVFNIRRWAAAAAVFGTIGIAAYFINKSVGGKVNGNGVAVNKKPQGNEVKAPNFPTPPQATVESSVKIDTTKSTVFYKPNESHAEPISKTNQNTSAVAANSPTGNDATTIESGFYAAQPSAPTTQNADDNMAKAQAEIHRSNAASLDMNADKKENEVGLSGPANQANYAYNNITNNYFAGAVTDNTGKPLRGATVSIFGTRNETQTDNNGRFRLLLNDTAATVQMMYTGYNASQTVLRPGFNQSFALMPTSASGGMTEVPQSSEKDKYVGVKRKARPNYLPPIDYRISVRVERAAQDFVQYVQLNTTKAFYEDGEKVVGTLKLKFDIDKFGRPYNISIADSLCVPCHDHFINLLKTGPNWKPINSKRNRVDFWIE